MDKDFEKKVKQKRIRTIAVAVVVLAAVIYLITGTKVEKADYTESLRSEIQTAEALYDENKDNVGDNKGQYTKTVMKQFKADITAAKNVLEDESSEYNDIKTAYETLKDQIDTFKNSANSKDLKVEEKGNKDKTEENSQYQDSEVSQSDSTQAAEDTKGTESVKQPEKQPAKDNVQNEPESKSFTVSLAIRCDTLAADPSKLKDKSLQDYVPADGVILYLPKVKVKKGETVYDVLDRVCRDKGIHMEAVYTPNYGADYIEGINYLYEFDAGEQSGWMYKVNGVFPNYGCSDYVLEDGDSIVWAYTCDMGKDLGKQM